MTFYSSIVTYIVAHQSISVSQYSLYTNIVAKFIISMLHSVIWLSYRIAKNRVFWASGNRLVESYRRTDKLIFNSSHNLPLKFVYIVKFAEKNGSMRFF